jgi:arabinose-5-phosphate isomerase
MTKTNIQIAKRVIKQEIKGLEEMLNLGAEFDQLVELILKIKGRVVLSGMGKSGHVASKIAATLASTGTPAFTVHPGEASHGDLGMITKDDVLILLSNSGETKELSDLTNYAKRFNIPLVGVVRRKESQLVDVADIAIVLPDVDEASHVNAPTTSTTMMLVLGDAIAVTLAERKGFSEHDFSVFHPGGKLGSNFITIEKIMRSGKDLPLVSVDTKMSDALVEMTKKSLGCVGVCNAEGLLVGIVTDGDLRRHMGKNLLEQKAVDVMTKNPTTFKENALAVEAMAVMNNKNITNIFIIEDGKPVGMIHLHDCLRAGIA